MRAFRPRFTVRRMMGAVAVSAVGVALLMALPETAWVGNASVPLEFLVLDAPTGRPIAGASVLLIEGLPEHAASTGPDGRATLVVRATTGGRSSWLRTTRTVNYGWAMSVSAEGHNRVVERLADRSRGPRFHSGEVPPPIEVRLSPGVK